MSDAGKKYLWFIAIGCALVILMRITDFIGSLKFGFTVLTFLGILFFIRTLLPESMKQARTALVVAMTLTIFGCFVVFPLTQTFLPQVPYDVKRSSWTTFLAQRLNFTKWFYDPATFARQEHEEFCMRENVRLTDGANSEIRKTVLDIEKLIADNKGKLDVLAVERKPLSEMTPAEVLAQQDSKNPLDQYYTLQLKLQRQRTNAVKVYELCLSNGPKPVEKTKVEKGAPHDLDPHQHSLRDLNIQNDMNDLRETIRNTTVGDMTQHVVLIGYGMAAVFLILSFLLAAGRQHRGGEKMLYTAVILAAATTILYFIQNAK